MPYCRNCGAALAEDAAYCPNCGTPVKPAAAQLRLASWGERFVAWLIDIVIINILLTPIRLLAVWSSLTWAPPFIEQIPFVDLGPSQLIYFIYWTIMEGTYGQSLGKMALRIKVTRINGQPVDLAHAALESLGKAFLLPIDLIIGWILYASKKQRLLNYASETIVIKAAPRN